MRRYLVIANQTLVSEDLLEKVTSCHAEEAATFHLVVPATPPPGGNPWSEGEANALASHRLEEALARYRELGIDVDGEVEVANPVHAVGNVMRHLVFDELIISTLPLGVSQWIGQDVVSRLRRAVDIRVTHVVTTLVHA